MKQRAVKILLAFLLLVPDWVWACTVCFKDPNDPMVKGANSGVLFLLAVIVFVLLLFAGLIFYFKKRAQSVL